jgi:hypothetical protein
MFCSKKIATAINRDEQLLPARILRQRSTGMSNFFQQEYCDSAQQG